MPIASSRGSYVIRRSDEWSGEAEVSLELSEGWAEEGFKGLRWETG